jgi:hypothetical protein
MIQLINRCEVTMKTGGTYTYSSTKNQSWLDGENPYDGTVTSNPYTAGDYPGAEMPAAGGSTGVNGYRMGDHFQDYFLWQPPGSSTFVSLGLAMWTWNGSALYVGSSWINSGTASGTAYATPGPSPPASPLGTYTGENLVTVSSCAI